MKIVVPVEANKTDVCPNFGRAPYFLVVDQGAGTSDLHENAAAMAEGGAGTKAAQIVVDFGTEVVIAPRIGENAVTVLKAAGIELYQSEGNSPEANLKAFAAGTLGKLEKIHSGFHGKLWN